MKSKPGHGHRRTQSDRFSENLAPPKLKIEIDQIENDSPQIIKCLEQSTRRNKTKTILIQDLELPKEQSEQNQMFMFGRNHAWTKSTLINSHPSNQVLSKIPEAPEKRSKSYMHNKENGFGEMKKGKKMDQKQKQQGQKNRQGMHSENNRYKKDNNKNKMNIESKHCARGSHLEKNNSSIAKFHKKTKTSKNSDPYKSDSFKVGQMHIASSYYFHFQKQKIVRPFRNGQKINKPKVIAVKEKELKQNRVKACKDEKQRKQKQKIHWNDIYGVGMDLEGEGVDDWEKEFISQTIIKEGSQKKPNKRKKSNYQKQKIRQKFRESKQIQNFNKKKGKEEKWVKKNEIKQKNGVAKPSSKQRTKK